MQFFEIEGGHKLQGSIEPQGSKNEALQILSACLLTEEQVVVDNVPDIIDIQKHLKILEILGVSVKRLSKTSYRLQRQSINKNFFENEIFRESSSATRGSITILGPLVSLLEEFRFYRPGGDNIGQRHIDAHISTLEKFGVSFMHQAEQKSYLVKSRHLKGTYILMEEASVTATANAIMAAVKAKGATTLYNAACEPYIQQLCHFLVQMGAKILGIGSNLLTIEGVEKLGGAKHNVLPDMIEVGSFIAIALATRSKITISNCHVRQLGMMPLAFEKIGAHLTYKGDDIIVDGTKTRPIRKNLDESILKIDDSPWPGLSPDILSIMLVCSTTLKGTVLFHQKMFESRLFFVDKLINMGAQIILCDPHRATVIGLDSENALIPLVMNSPDIRAGIALLIAAMCARGTSRIYNIFQIDRGYMEIDRRLNELGASIKRLERTHA